MEHDATVCPRCGNLRSVCSDPAIDWHPRESTCYATATIEWGLRRLEEKRKDEPLAGAALHSMDGASVWVSEHPPMLADGEVDPFA
jgi:hypothetical protein